MHRTRNGNRKRCGNHSCTLSLTDPDNPGGRLKLYCLDCWMECRTEKTVPHPAIERDYQQARKDGLTQVATGC